MPDRSTPRYTRSSWPYPSICPHIPHTSQRSSHMPRRNAMALPRFWRPYQSISDPVTGTTHPNPHRPRRNAMVLPLPSPPIKTITSHSYHPRVDMPPLDSPSTTQIPDPTPSPIPKPSGMGECIICHEDLGDGRALVWCQAQCQQVYHLECMGKWLKESRGRGSCPLWHDNSLFRFHG